MVEPVVIILICILSISMGFDGLIGVDVSLIKLLNVVNDCKYRLLDLFVLFINTTGRPNGCEQARCHLS